MHAIREASRIPRIIPIISPFLENLPLKVRQLREKVTEGHC